VIKNTDERDTPPWHVWLKKSEAMEIKETQSRLARKLAYKLKKS
jgi:hypothetical protein